MTYDMTLKGRPLSDEQMAEVARVVRKHLPLKGSQVSMTTTADLREAFESTTNPTQYRGTGKRGEMRGRMK